MRQGYRSCLYLVNTVGTMCHIHQWPWMHVVVGLCKQLDYTLVAAVAGFHYYIQMLLDMV